MPSFAILSLRFTSFNNISIEFIKLSSEEEARVTERCAQEILNEWAAAAEQKGVPAREFLRRYKAIYKDLSE